MTEKYDDELLNDEATESEAEPSKKQPTDWFDWLFAKIPLKRFQNPPSIVSVLCLSGVIGHAGRFSNGLTLSGLDDDIKAAFQGGKRLKAVALVINSPGGSPVQSELIATRIRALSEEKDIPVIVFVEDVAASGGYWLACSGDEIIASESSIVGSIGVIAAGFGFTEAIKKLGIERRVYTQGENKSILDPFKPEKDSDIEIVKGVQREIHEAFKSLVRARRGNKINSADEDTLFSGEFWTGAQAKTLGLIDGIGTMHAVLQERYGKEVKLRKIQSKKHWLQRKLGVDKQEHMKNLVNACVDVLQERVQWNKFGG